MDTTGGTSRRDLLTGAAGALAAAAPALAQQTGVGNPAATPAGTPERAPGMPAAHEPNDADRIFAREVLIGGRRYPFAGTVSMDNITVEVGAPDAVRIGDPVTLIGRAGTELLTAAAVSYTYPTLPTIYSV